VGKVESVARTDLDHPSGSAVDELLAVGPDTLFHKSADTSVVAGEERVAVTHGVLRKAGYL
jgi:hypothetical protein